MIDGSWHGSSDGNVVVGAGNVVFVGGIVGGSVEFVIGSVEFVIGLPTIYEILRYKLYSICPLNFQNYYCNT